MFLRGTAPLDHIFEDFVYFLQKQSDVGQGFHWIRLEMFQGTQESQFYFSRNHGFEVTVKMCESQYFPCFDPQINNYLVETMVLKLL